MENKLNLRSAAWGVNAVAFPLVTRYRVAVRPTLTSWSGGATLPQSKEVLMSCECGATGKLAQCKRCRRLWCWDCLRQHPTFGNYLRALGSFTVTCDCGNEMALLKQNLE